MRRAVGAAAAFLLAMLFFAAPAGAGVKATDLSSPSGTLGSNVATLSGTFTYDEGEREVVARFTSRRGPDTQTASSGRANSQGAFSFAGPPLKFNGTYDLVVDFINYDPDRGIWDDGCTCKRNPPITRAIDLLVPPGVPGGVNAVFDETSRSVRVTWAANGEPDLIGYLVQRKVGNGQPQDVAEVFVPEANDIVDDNLPTNKAEISVTYLVTAYRQAVQPGEAVASTGKGESSAVIVPKAPATTTTTGPGGGTTTPSTPPTTRKGFGTPVTAPPATTTTRPGGGSPRPGGVSAGAFASGLNGPVDAPPITADTFESTLPFQQRNDYDPDEDVELTDESGDPASVSRREEDQTQALAFVGAALNVGVWASLGLWLRAQVRRPEDETEEALASVAMAEEVDEPSEVSPFEPVETARVRVRRRPVATATSEPKPEPVLNRPTLVVRRERPLRARQA